MEKSADIVKDLVPILAFFSFWLGACIASFLNVVIWRVPRGESIVSPPSHCPKCGAAIKWWQNVPILSWLVLRGKCANCHAAISPRYIMVEAIGGVLFLAAFFKCFAVGPDSSVHWTPMVVSLLAWWIWIALMIAGSFIDFDHQLLPDFTTVGGMVLGVVGSVFQGVWYGLTYGWNRVAAMVMPVASSVGGLAFGFGLLWLVRWLGSKAFKREAMGMGDVFLMGAVGAMFGPIAVLVTLVVSSIVGSVVGLTMIALSRTRLGGFAAIPFGPYICIGCLVSMFWGPSLVGWYLHLLGINF